MVSTLTWVLAGIVLYTVGAMALRARGRLPDAVRVSGPIITLHTGRGRAFLDWLAAPRRFWRAWGNLGVGIALVVMVGTFLMVIDAGRQAVEQPERTPIQNPQDALVIPGVNDFLPPAAAPEIVLGLLVGLVVHEGGHGLLCRVEDIEIDSMGLAFFSFIPVGAFVEPDEESRRRASRGDQSRMFAAGVTNNFFVALLCFVLLFGPVAGSISVAAGVPVGDTPQGTAAADADLEYGDVITSVNGDPVANESAFERAVDRADGRQVTLGTRDGGTVTLNRSLLLTRAVPDIIDDIELSRDEPTVVQRVNGSAVHTERGFARAVENRSVIDLETNRGNATLPVGAYALRVTPDGPLAEEGAPTDARHVVVTSIDGQRTPNFTALSDLLADREPGSTASVVLYVDGERREYEVTLGENANAEGALVGISEGQAGYSGLVLDDVGIDTYPAAQFHAFLGGASGPFGGLLDGTFLQQLFLVLVLPFFSTIDPASGYNFAGFISPVSNFYAVSGPLEPLGGGVFLLANVLFWTGWVNLNLGLFNCIPTFPLDGGHIFRASAESFVARLPIEDGRRLTTAITASISLVMLAGLLAMLFGPQLLN